MPEFTPLLSGFAAALGAREPIRETTDEQVRAQAETLRGDGLRHYRHAHEDLLDLAVRSATRTLSRASGQTPVAAAVYASDTFTTETPSKALRSLLVGSGLDDVDGTVVGGRGCDNLWVALAAARTALREQSGRCRTAALIVTADRVARGTRWNQDARAVMSDGAASCLMSWDTDRPSLQLRAGAAMPVSPPAGAPPMLRARHHLTALRALSERLHDVSGLPGDACGRVVTSNIGLNLAQMFRSAVGGRHATLYRPAVTDVGHCFAADTVHTMGLLLAEPDTKAGDLVLVAATSPYSCSLMVLEVITPGPCGGDLDV